RGLKCAELKKVQGRLDDENQNQRHRAELRRRRQRPVAGDEPFPRLRPDHVGRAGRRAQAQFQGAALRHARPRRERRARRRVHARHDGLRRARPLTGAWRRALPLGRPVDGRDDRPDLRAESSRDVREHGARRHHQPLRARGAAAVAGPHQDRAGQGHGGAGRDDAAALVHRGVPQDPSRGDRARERDDPRHARPGLRRLLPRYSENQPHRAAEGSEVPVAGDRRRAGRGHAGRDGARDPRRAARIRAGGHPLGLALVQPRAAGGFPARADCFPEQAPLDHPGASRHPSSREEGKNPKPLDENPPARRHARQMSMRILLLAVAFAFAANASAQPTGDAKSWPSRAIHLIVPFPAGSSPDLIARVLSEKLAPALGTPVVVENRPGAGGNLGTALVARAAPDGYTIGISIPGPLAVNTVLYRKMEYDPFKDLAPVSLVGASPNILVVDPALKVDSVKEFVALARSQPGKLNYGSVGNGSSSHLTMELFKEAAGIELVHVPYPGSPQVN